MPRPHDAVIPVPEFWRVLLIVVAAFGLALAISWSIDAVAAQQDRLGAVTSHGTSPIPAAEHATRL